MHKKDEHDSKRVAGASRPLPDDVKQRVHDRKQELLELMRNEDQAFRKRKTVAIAYWIGAVILFWLPALTLRSSIVLDGYDVFNLVYVVAWVASFVLLAAGVISIIALLIRRRPIKDAQILSALYDIEALLQQLVHDQKK